LRRFFDFLADNDVTALQHIGPLHGAAYLEAMKQAKRSVATQKQHMAAVRMLFDYPVTGGILAHNPILSLRAPRQSVTKGKTPTLSAEDAGELPERRAESEQLWLVVSRKRGQKLSWLI
jgi:site-specific recombinase XerD